MKRIKLILLTVATVMAVAVLTQVSNAKESQNSPPPPDQSSPSSRENAAKAIWLTDFGVARQKAKAERKSILLDFTGSDWCGWCMKLDREVFSTPEFRDFADKHFGACEG